MVCAVQDAVVGNDEMIKRLKPYMEDPNLTVENVSMYHARLEFRIYCSLQGPVDIFQTFFFRFKKCQEQLPFSCTGQRLFMSTQWMVKKYYQNVK